VSTQNSLPSGSASTAQPTSPWPTSTRTAPALTSARTAPAWSSSGSGATSRWTRFLPGVTSRERSSSRYGPASCGERSETQSGAEAVLTHPVASSQKPATASGSAHSATTAATGPVSR
jgi:hypothetical protein